eukprot:CAMPEP_0185365254 /NCGR_PEP_ID=MMETSP1364-20130426/12936_1 /TAXON_ID=38817 /ORGANISM="Gephyrocapsa oceanica, Strain RCC1303" /LENGTH=172 /DNA_ID=CAMNT_0027965785 /DNA_START=29 /DNA_END=543 /DNA_ORIENTATION=-
MALAHTLALALLVSTEAVRLAISRPSLLRGASRACESSPSRCVSPQLAEVAEEATEAAALIQQTVASNEVVIFSKSWCPFCQETKQLFDEMNQPYTAIELDERGDGEQLQETLLELTEQRTVPNVFVAGTHVGGNDDTQRAARSGSLAQLLASAEATGVVVPTAAAAASGSP